MKNDPAAYNALMAKLQLEKKRKIKRGRGIWSTFLVPKKKARVDEEKKAAVAIKKEDEKEANKENVKVKTEVVPESSKKPTWKQDELNAKIGKCSVEIEALKTLISGASFCPFYGTLIETLLFFQLLPQKPNEFYSTEKN